MSKIKLQSSDGEIFETDIKAAMCSLTIKTMLDDLGWDEDDNEVIPLPKIKSSILKKVIEWADYHKDDPPPVEEEEEWNREKQADNISGWDRNFICVDKSMLFDLILAANFLDVKGLLDLACKTVANMIKGKKPEEIRAVFNIRNNFTAAEDEQIRMENEWCEDK